VPEPSGTRVRFWKPDAVHPGGNSWVAASGCAPILFQWRGQPERRSPDSCLQSARWRAAVAAFPAHTACPPPPSCCPASWRPSRLGRFPAPRPIGSPLSVPRPLPSGT